MFLSFLWLLFNYFFGSFADGNRVRSWPTISSGIVRGTSPCNFIHAAGSSGQYHHAVAGGFSSH
jgi:hypothetical protein